jgi:hypothetical protein
MVETFHKCVQKLGLHAVIKKENELTPHDISDKDLCISIGK